MKYKEPILILKQLQLRDYNREHGFQILNLSIITFFNLELAPQKVRT